ncbi:MAG: hypothetical protein CM1200mP3_04690 [Chloroflexota bacterium]|nr:MAG: hypothetical protein CM1200mP3_04690 [Chloroflexota bacterium]
MAEEEKVLLTEAAKNLIGQTTGVVEMYGVVDGETGRDSFMPSPTRTPGFWDEELANPRFGELPHPAYAFLAANRKPPFGEKGPKRAKS